MWRAAGIAALLALAACRTDQPDTAQIASNESLAARKAECQRLYSMLGDPKLTVQQTEAIRVSMNAKFCGGLVP